MLQSRGSTLRRSGAVVSLHRIVEFYSDHCRRCRTQRDLFNLTDGAIRELGFDRWAMVQGLWFRRPSTRLIRMDTFNEFADIFIEREYYRDDPALLACQRIDKPFLWTQIRDLIPFMRRQEMILREASRHSLCVGLTVPLGVTGEPPGCFSFVTSKPELPSRWHQRAAALIAADAFHEARRLHGFPARATTGPQLSKRKLEILELAAIGKTDREIGMILGIKQSSVETYMYQMRQAFDVYSRTQLCNNALRLGMLAFEDAISGF